MAKELFVARFPISYGAKDGSKFWLESGDELPSEMSDDEVLTLRQIGSAVPKNVWDALNGAETALAEAQAAQEAATVEAQQQQVRLASSPQRAVLEAQQKALNAAPPKSQTALLPQEVGQTEPEPVVETPAAPKTEPPKAEPPKAEPPKTEPPKAEPKSGPQVRAKTSGTKE
jgi:hypothetical protein